MTLERRHSARRTPSVAEPLSRVRLRAGRELRVVDISASGVLVEGDVRLLPGTHIDVHVINADGRLLVRSRVVRAYISELTSKLLTYRGAFAFERHIDVGYALPSHHVDVEAPRSSIYPDRAA